jgi:hypothetical protein
VKDNNNVILLKKLISDTQNNTIVWVKANKPEIGWYSYHETWKGDKKITDDKKLSFVLNFCVNDLAYAEVRVFFINDLIETREKIADVEPKFFSWKTQKFIKILIDAVRHQKESSDANRLRQIVGPMPNKNFDEVVY